MNSVHAIEDTQPSGQVTEHLERLDKAVSLVTGAADRLELRLALVLMAEPEDGNSLAEVAAVQPQRVPVAERLVSLEARLDRLHRQLEGVYRRCEL